MSEFDYNNQENNGKETENKENNTEKASYDANYTYGYSSATAQGYRSSIEYAPKKRNKKAKRAFSVLALALCFVIVIAVSSFAGYYFGATNVIGGNFGGADPIYNPVVTTNGTQSGQSTPKVPTTTIVMSQSDSPVVSDGEGTYVYVNEKAAPSVVSIVTEAISYNVFYGNYVDSGAGSGVIIANSGNYYYIITNNHVIDGFSNITVYTAGNTGDKGYTATVMGADWTNDIAVIRIESDEKLTVAEPAKSASVVTGQSIAAIGNPLGMFSGTITPGIISSVARNVKIEGVSMELMQHSASVSPGNSGGGLFNMYGQLIGIVNAKSSGTGVEGIGFAIPVDTAVRVADDIINKGYATGMPYLGISYNNSNLYILNYQYNHELAASGQQTIQENDILSAIDGKTVSSTSDIRSVLSSKEIGEKVKLTLIRIVKVDGYRYSYDTYEVEVIIHEYIPTAE